MWREGRVYRVQPKSRLSAPVPVKTGADKSLPQFPRTVNKVPPVDGPKFNSHTERIGVIDRATCAPIRDGLLRRPLDRAAENRSLEESFPAAVPVASWFEAFALSEQSGHNLQLRGDSNQPSSSTIRLSEQFAWT